MGAYQNIYIGPYMLVKHKQTVKTDHRAVCVTAKCKNYNKNVATNFCAHCGNEVKTKAFTHSTTKSVDDLLEDMEIYDILRNVHAGGTPIYKDKCVLLPNSFEGRPKKYDVDSDFCGEINLQDINDIDDIAWFMKKYAKEINLILQEFGQDNTTIQWGLVIHYS